jgi:hypothetical protein
VKGLTADDCQTNCTYLSSWTEVLSARRKMNSELDDGNERNNGYLQHYELTNMLQEVISSVCFAAWKISFISNLLNTTGIGFCHLRFHHSRSSYTLQSVVSP